MTHSNIILISTALLVMSAGVVVGRLSDRIPAEQAKPQAPAHAPQHSRSWLVEQLNLTSDQRLKMDAIWADTRAQIDKTFQSRSDLEKARDQAIHDLLTPDQRTAYDQINLDFHTKRDELFKDRNKLVQDANDRSRALLDETQQKQWDVVTKEMQNRDRRGPGQGPGMGPRSRPFMDSNGDRRHADRQGDRTPDDRAPVENPTTNPTGGA